MAASKGSRANQLAVRPSCTTANIRLLQDAILRHSCCILSTVFTVKRKHTWCNQLHRNSEGQRGLGKLNKIWDPNMNKASKLTFFNHYLASSFCHFLLISQTIATVLRTENVDLFYHERKLANSMAKMAKNLLYFNNTKIPPQNCYTFCYSRMPQRGKNYKPSTEITVLLNLNNNRPRCIMD